MYALQILRFALFTTIGALLGVFSSLAIGASSSSISAADTRVIYKAVGLTERAEKLFNVCGEIVQPELEAIDLNSDGQPEVFVTVLGSCQGGAAEPNCLCSLKAARGIGRLILAFLQVPISCSPLEAGAFPTSRSEALAFAFLYGAGTVVSMQSTSAVIANPAVAPVHFAL